MKKLFTLIVNALLAFNLIAGDSANNGGIDGVYDVEVTEVLHKSDLKRIFSLSQLPATIKDPLFNEVFNSPYLKADKDVKYEGRRFPGDWIIGDKDKLFHARTLPSFGGATTLFPVFFTLKKEKQIEIIIHEALHRLEFLSPNNISEDYVVATVNKILNDVEVVNSGKNIESEKSREVLAAWFKSTQLKKEVPWEKMHWVGHVNLYFDKDFTRPNGNQIISFYPKKNEDIWYVETSKFSASWPHVAVRDWRIYDIAGPALGGNGPKNFVKTFKFHVKFKDYYFVGNGKSLLDPIEGKIYEVKTNLYAGQFRLSPYHDGGTGIGLSKFPKECGPDATLPLGKNCYGKSFTGTGTGTNNGYNQTWPFN